MLLIAAATAVAAQYALALRGTLRPGWWHAPAAAAGPALSGDDLASASGLDAAFGRIGYRLDTVARGGAVPRLRLEALPSDMADLPEGDARKAVFLRLMLPLVLEADEEIARDRRRLEAVAQRAARDGALAPAEAAWVADLASRYDVRPGPGAVERLLRRVDTVPPSLALAQAALETGWGTSRLVRRDNNLFGHTVETGDGNTTRSATFATAGDAVRAYVHNLNTHRAYRDLRRARARAHARGTVADGTTLAGALAPYSELGRAYVGAVRTIIHDNTLERFDGARLQGAGTAGSI